MGRVNQAGRAAAPSLGVSPSWAPQQIETVSKFTWAQLRGTSPSCYRLSASVYGPSLSECTAQHGACSCDDYVLGPKSIVGSSKRSDSDFLRLLEKKHGEARARFLLTSLSQKKCFFSHRFDINITKLLLEPFLPNIFQTVH